MKIKLNEKNIQSVKKLLSLCPNNFSFVPLKFYKDEDGNSFATIETISINGDLVFSGIVNLEEDIAELENNSGLIVRLPMIKSVINNIFGSDFKNVVISKAKIIAKDAKKKIEIALYKMEEDEISNFPYDSDSLYKLVLEMNGIEDSPFVKIDMSETDIKDIVSGFSIINEATEISIKYKNSNLKFNVEDYSGNVFNYNLDTDKTDDFEGKFDNNFIKLLSTVSRNKDEFESIMLYSALIFSTTLTCDNIKVTIATTALKD